MCASKIYIICTMKNIVFLMLLDLTDVYLLWSKQYTLVGLQIQYDVRFCYKGVVVAIFKLKLAINVEQFLHTNFFEYRCKSSHQGQMHLDVKVPKIRGMRQTASTTNLNYWHDPALERNTQLVKIEGCHQWLKVQLVERSLSVLVQTFVYFVIDLWSNWLLNWRASMVNQFTLIVD
jgi:hypothetical protein